VLLDKLGHARSLGVEGNHNALHGLRGIVDRAKNGCEITLNQRKSGGDQIKGGEGRGWIPLDIAKKQWVEL
jgi:hypothetical protein